MIAAISNFLFAILARAAVAVQPFVATAGGDASDAPKAHIEALGKTFSAISNSVRTEERHSPAVLLVVAAVVAMCASLYGMWRWHQQRATEPTSRALLRLVCDQLNLSAPHRQLLWMLGTAASLEPASALASPQLLTCLVHQAEQAGLHLSVAKTLQIGQILDAVSAASTDSN